MGNVAILHELIEALARLAKIKALQRNEPEHVVTPTGNKGVPCALRIVSQLLAGPFCRRKVGLQQSQRRLAKA